MTTFQLRNIHKCVLGLAVLLPSLAGATTASQYETSVYLVDGSGTQFLPPYAESSVQPAPASWTNGTFPQSGGVTFNPQGVLATASVGAEPIVCGATCQETAQISGSVFLTFTVVANNGTPANGAVPIIVTGSTALSSSGNGVGSIDVEDVSPAIQEIATCSAAVQTGCGTSNYEFLATAGSVTAAAVANGASSGLLWVQSSADAGIACPLGPETTCPGTAGGASAFADVSIAIDPTFLAANPGYSLIVSEAATAPEPATFSLAGAALVGLIALRRRKKN